MPTTINGKLDRRGLPPWKQASNTETRSPQTHDEQLLCGFFAEVLGLESVSLDDDFFELGGHSLLAMRLVNRIRGAFKTELSIVDFFDAPTVAGIEARLSASRGRRAVLQAAS